MQKMQLTIFDVSSKPEVIPEATGEKVVFEKWKMLELLDSLSGQKFLIRGKDDYQEFCLPFQAGKMSYSAIYKTGFPAVCSLGSFNYRKLTSFARLSGYLNRITKENNLLSFNYDQTIHPSKGNKQIQTEDSVVSFDLSSNYIDLGSDNRKGKRAANFNDMSIEEKISEIIGKTYSVQVRCHNDLFGEIISYPCRISDIQINEDEITILGSNHLFLKAKGFVKIRYTGNLLFDTYNQDGGYTRTISFFE